MAGAPHGHLFLPLAQGPQGHAQPHADATVAAGHGWVDAREAEDLAPLDII